MTPVGLWGYWRWRRGRRANGATALIAYAGMNMLTLGHYLYAPPGALADRINLFIWLQIVPALSLLLTVVGLTFGAGKRTS